MFSLEYLSVLRASEIDMIAELIPGGARILEIGAGSGQQALELQRRGFLVTAVDVGNSNYAADRVFPVIDYDGKTLPVASTSVDVVFSSNVLEHIADLSGLHSEIRRVLRPDGMCVHVMPTHVWRLWT